MADRAPPVSRSRSAARGSTRRASSSSFPLTPRERERKRDAHLSSFRDAWDATRRDYYRSQHDASVTSRHARYRTNACEARRFVTVSDRVNSRSVSFSHVTLPLSHTIRTMDENRLTSLTAAPRCAASATRRRQDKTEWWR